MIIILLLHYYPEDGVVPHLLLGEGGPGLRGPGSPRGAGGGAELAEQGGVGRAFSGG